MKLARIRLVIAAVLFFGWMGWLLYLAMTAAGPTVVSRSQVMVATHFVLVDPKIDAETKHPQVEQVVDDDLRPGTDGGLKGKSIRILNLRDARVAGTPDRLFSRPGPYLMPLTKVKEGEYLLTPPPRSPGHDGGVRQPWAYLWSRGEVARQLVELIPPSR